MFHSPVLTSCIGRCAADITDAGLSCTGAGIGIYHSCAAAVDRDLYLIDRTGILVASNDRIDPSALQCDVC